MDAADLRNDTATHRLVHELRCAQNLASGQLRRVHSQTRPENGRIKYLKNFAYLQNKNDKDCGQARRAAKERGRGQRQEAGQQSSARAYCPRRSHSRQSWLCHWIFYLLELPAIRRQERFHPRNSLLHVTLEVPAVRSQRVLLDSNMLGHRHHRKDAERQPSLQVAEAQEQRPAQSRIPAQFV